MIRKLVTLAASACLVAVAPLKAQNFFAMWGSSADDAWIVGNGPAALHWDGQSWNAVPVPGTDYLFAIWGSGPDDVWAVGPARVIHWNGTQWEDRCPRPAEGAPCARDIYVGVSGFGPNDVYVVAQSPSAGAPPRLLRWDGRRWSPTTVPLPFIVRSGGLAAQGNELVLVGSIRTDPEPPACPPTPMCALNTEVIARLQGSQWLVTASSDAVAGGAYWATIAQAGRTLMTFGSALNIVGRAATEAHRLQVSTFVPAARGVSGMDRTGFATWEAVSLPPGDARPTQAGIAGDQVVVVLASGFAHRPIAPRTVAARRWTVVPVGDSEVGVRTADFESAVAVWGASAGDFWILTRERVIRVVDDSAELALGAQCVAMGARASGSAGCTLFGGSGTGAPRRALPAPTRRPKP